THFKSAVVNNNSSDVYLFDTNWGEVNTCNITSYTTLAALPTQASSGKTEFSTTYTGQIAWDSEKNAFVLDLTQLYNGQEYSASYILGETYDLTGISIALDGNSTNGDKDVFTVSNFTISHTVPEPTTATLSLLALAGLAARRRRK
ncbi:MAG: PEP-CTERM sorting domain-containing protein, partial [Akkermansia sp.]|nr:PEP-CTERM sorting domain-containing protein [Akkermansia sp.]